MGIGDMIGKKLFLKHVLVMNTSAQRMALVDASAIDLAAPGEHT
jgi:hypothetical protein